MEDTLYTIGHSTHPIEEFLKILQAYDIRLLADVRTIPRSRHNPQFEQAALEQSLPAQDIRYAHIKELGGLRHASKVSVNTGWRNMSFRGYADHMQTDEFRTGLERLMQLARTQPTAIMCSEAVPWRCHRSLIGDALLVHGWQVVDIMGEKSAKPHLLTPWARVDGDSLTYPATDPLSESLKDSGSREADASAHET